MPWRRAQFEVERGIADGFFAATQTPERDVFAEISAPIAPQIWRWYLTPDNEQKLTDSRDLTVGVLAGSAMERFLTESHYTHIQSAPTTENLIKQLKSGRFDAILANERVVEDSMRSLNMSNANLHSIVQGDHPLGAYFGKTFLAAHDGFLAKFNAMIGSCK
jgi:ABC-type amino acid transport substrate-binding protein